MSLKKKENLLDSLGKRAEGAANAATSQQADSAEAVGAGDSLLNNVGPQSSDVDSTAKSSQASADDSKKESTASSKEEPSGSVENPDSWDMDSAFKEIKKLREENKSHRLKYAENLDKFKAESELKVQAKQEELQALVDAKKELDNIKAEQEDKKRDLTEKLAHRESKLSEYQTLLEAQKTQYDEKVSKLETILNQYEADKEAQNEIYHNRLQEEVNKIPDKFREQAQLMIKGAGDPRDALTSLAEAKLKGMFEEKTVVVNHDVPGARDGARASRERLDEAAKEQRKSMSSSQKIKSALDTIRSGEPNNAFRLNK